MSSTPRFDHFRWDGVSFGGPAEVYLGFDAPWYVQTIDGGIRVDGVERSDKLSPPVPGEEITYNCVCLPQPSNGASTDDHRARFESLRELLIKAPDVATYGPPGGAAYYREQHGGRDGAQLVRIGPLAPDAGGDVVDQTQPPSRDSIHQDRWAVVTGGSALASRPEEAGEVTLETVTIASTETYSDRATVRAARENNGF